MDSISSCSSCSSSSIVQAVLANQESRGQFDMSLLKTAQENDKQQGAAAVQLIEAAGRVVDIKV